LAGRQSTTIMSSFNIASWTQMHFIQPISADVFCWK